MSNSKMQGLYSPHGLSRHTATLICWVSLVTLMLLCIFRQDVTELMTVSEWALWGLSLVSLGSILLIKAIGFTWLSPPMVVGALLWLFHFGWNFIAPLFPKATIPFAFVFPWLEYDSWFEASVFSSTCLVSYTFGCGLYGAAQKKAPVFKAKRLLKSVSDLGYLMLVLGILGIVGVLFQEGFYFLQSTYGEGYSIILDKFSPSLVLFSFGMPLVLSKNTEKSFVFVTVGVLLVTGILMVYGIRSYAMFGFVTFLVLVRGGGRKIRPVMLFLVLLVTLASFSVMREVRAGFGTNQQAILVRASQTLERGILLIPEAFAEFGGTLETVSRAIRYTHASKPLYGLSYLVSIRFILWDRWVDPQGFLILSSFQNFTRLYFPGGGGSIVGEAFYNFHWLGGLIVFVPLGMFLTHISCKNTSDKNLVISGLVLYITLTWIRGYSQAVTTLSFYYFILWQICRVHAALMSTHPLSRKRAQVYGSDSTIPVS